VEAVVLRDLRTGAEERLRCRAVVLAAGSINTTQILLQSRSADFPAGLGNSHDVLGRYLHDHPLGKLMIDLGSPVAIHPPAYLTRAPLEQALPLYGAGCAQWTGVKLLAESVLRGHPGRLAWIGFNVFGTMAPSEENRLTLDPTRTSSDGSNALSLSIRHPPESIQVLEEARDQVVAILARTGLRPRVTHWHVEAPGVSHHYAGSCRMHASPRFGMLDGFSRLRDVRNVVVADSAAFTTGPEKNPVLTAMTLAARAADRLAQDLHAGLV
jgi:choline dehydrogenase-like flavoprotein